MEQDETSHLQEEIRKMEKLAVKRARRMAVSFGVLAISLLISMVYAFVQHVVAERNAEEAMRQMNHVQEIQKEAEKSAEEALKQREIARVALAIAEARQIELEMCRVSKK